MKRVNALDLDAYGVQAEFVDPQEGVAMLDEIEARGTAIDIVFNKVAVQIAYCTDFWQTLPEDFDVNFLNNVIASAMICHQFIPKMIQRRVGRGINTTSGLKNKPAQAGYSSSKTALDKFTRDIGSKREGANGMINLADPGWCCTDMGGSNTPSVPESSITGVVVGAFVNDTKSRRLPRASTFNSVSLEEAAKKTESM